MKTGKELPSIKERGFIKTTDHRPNDLATTYHLPTDYLYPLAHLLAIINLREKRPDSKH